MGRGWRADAQYLPNGASPLRRFAPGQGLGAVHGPSHRSRRPLRRRQPGQQVRRRAGCRVPRLGRMGRQTRREARQGERLGAPPPPLSSNEREREVNFRPSRNPPSSLPPTLLYLLFHKLTASPLHAPLFLMTRPFIVHRSHVDDYRSTDQTPDSLQCSEWRPPVLHVCATATAQF